MKYFIIASIFFSICLSQATGLALYGIGEEVKNSDPATLALGNSSFFSGNSKNIAAGSPSSVWRSPLTRFTIHSGMNLLSNPQLSDQFQHNLTTFSLLFPLGDKRVFGFGIQPAYRTNKLEIVDQDFHYLGADESVTGTPIAYKNTYSIDGGISELYLQCSQKIFSNFSIGIEYSVLFSNQSLYDELWTYDVQFSENETAGDLLIDELIENEDTLYFYAENGSMTPVRKFHQFSGNVFMMEGRYFLSQHEWVLRTSINGKTKVSTERTEYVNSEAFSDDFTYAESPSLADVGFGYHYRIAGKAGIIMELHQKYPFNLPEDVALFDIMPPGENSFHLGSYYQLQNSKIGFWNQLNFRGGVYFKQLDFASDKYFDYGAAIGIGLEYLGNSKSIDFALRAGKKESLILSQGFENYISFHISIINGEKWFLKRRRK